MMPAESVHVLAGYEGGAFTRHEVAVSYRVPPDFHPVGEHGVQAGDVAVLTLGSPIGTATLVPVPAVSGQAAMLGGYSQDRAEILLADADCRVLGTVPDRVGRPLELHSCEGTFGTSGAPLLVRLANGAWEAGGVQIASVAGRVGGLAVPSAMVQSLLRRQ